MAAFVQRASAALAFAGLGAMLVAGCRAESLLPVIESLSPNSGTMGAQPASLTLKGKHFAPKGNTVLFGPVSVENVASSDGETLRFAFPASRPATGEVPPMVLPAGTYEVRVKTASGTSNSVTFKLDQ